jgi:4-hydroxy-3-polyprenylbenzoate decarboxylase
MTYSSLRDFIEALEKTGQLVRVSEPVSPYLEMTEIGTRLIAEQGPAVLFERVRSSEFRVQEKNNHSPNSELRTLNSIPVLINLFGTARRIAFALGKKPEELREIGETLAFLKQPEPPGGWREAMEMLPILKTAMHMQPKHVSKAPCQEIVLTGDDIDLSMLPIQTCWPGEPAPLITWPLVVTKGPGSRLQASGEKLSGARNPEPDPRDDYNLGIYRMQVLGKNKTLMRWLAHRGGAQHHARWGKEKREPLPAAAVIGADPAMILAAVTPVPDTMSEYQFAGLLRGAKTELVDCKTIPLKVPASAEIVLEGFVSLDDYGDEGPYGDHTGYYNAVEKFPVFTVTAITMRKNPIYLTTYTGRAPDEPSVLGEALNEIFIPLLKQQFPEIVDFYLPPEGCSYRVAVVSIKKAYPGHAKRIMMGIWSFLRQFIYTKWVVVVDDDINIRDWKEVIWAISTRMDPVRDITLIDNTPIDYLDFASPEMGLGGKAGLDATNKWPPETSRAWGEKIYMKQHVIDKISETWQKMGLPGSGKPVWK